MNTQSISKYYEEHPIARIIVSMIPYVGGALDIALSTRWSKYHSTRVDDFLMKLQKELSIIEENSIHRDFLESEEFFDLVYQISLKTASSRCPETRTGYAKVLKSAICQEESTNTLEDIVRQIADFQEKDFDFVRIIKAFFDSGKEVSGANIFAFMKGQKYSTIECELQLYRFENLGLLDHNRNTLIGRGFMVFYKTTEFDKLASFLGL